MSKDVGQIERLKGEPAVARTYVGPIKHLEGKTVLVRPATHGKVLVQFDDMSLTRSGVAFSLKDPIPTDNDALGFGWHAFDPTDFTSEK